MTSLPNRTILIFSVLGIGLILAFLLIGSGKTQQKKTVKWPQETGTEPKTVYSRAEVENLIKEQLMKDKEDAEKVTPVVKPETRKRKLNSEIAVYLKKQEKEEKTESAPQPVKGLTIPTGTKIRAHLANAIFSLNVTSPVMALTDEDLLNENNTMVPKGTRFVGEAAVVQSRDRVNVRFHTAVLPDGRELHLKAMALGLDGSGGIQGKVDKQYDRSILKAAGEIVLSGASLVLGTRNNAMTLEDELRLNASRNLADDAQGALNGMKIEQSISVEAYTPILILFLEAV